MLEINDAIAIFAIETKINKENTREASDANFEHLVQLIRNLLLAINQAILYIKDYKSNTIKLLNLYQSEKVIKIIENYSKDLKVLID